MAEPIKSMAALKRRMAAAETITVTNHLRPEASGPRRILKCQGNGFWRMSKGYPRRCWTDYPAHGSTYRIDGPDQVTFLDKGAPSLTIVFDNPPV